MSRRSEPTVSRRSVLRSVAGTIAVSGISGVGTAQTATDWPQYGRTDARQSATPASGLPNEPSQRWILDLDQSIGSSPVIVGGRVYVTLVDGRVISASNEGDIKVYDLDSTGFVGGGRTGSITSTPTVVDGSMYVGGTGGSLYALTVPDGRQQWATPTSGTVRSSPAVTNQTVYVGDSDGILYSIDRPSGDRLAQATLPAAIVVPVSFRDGTIVAATVDGHVRVFSGSELSEVWSTSVGSVYRAPVCGTNRVFIGDTDGTITAFYLDDGSQAWEQSLDGEIAGGIASDGNTVYVTSRAGELTAMAVGDGTISWSVENLAPVRHPPTLTGSGVVVGTTDGTLAAFDSASGDRRWRTTVNAPVASPVAVGGETLYFGNNAGSVFAFGPATDATDASESSTDSEVPSETEGSSLFARLRDDYGTTAVGVGGGAATLALGYFGTKRLRNRRNETSTATGTDAPSGPPSSEARDRSDPVFSGGDSPDPSKQVDKPLNPAADLEPTPAIELESDTTYADFDIQRQIGAGGNADVHEATIQINDRSHTVALKKPRLSDMNTVDTDFFETFVTEAEVWSEIDDHPNVVSVIGWGKSPHPWIALEYMEAGHLAAQTFTDRATVVRHLAGICEGVHHAHQHGISHTDIKPENVLFTDSPVGLIPKVTDWGLATVLLEHSTSVGGLTPAYSAPEQFDTDTYGRTSTRTDVYQIGVLAYELLTGSMPFDRANTTATMQAILTDDPTPPTDVNPDLPQVADDVLLTALSKAKDDRYETALHLRDALARLV